MTQSDSNDENYEQTPTEVLWTAVGLEAGLGVLALLLGFWIGPSARELIPTLEHWPAIIGGLLLGVAATLPLLLLIGAIKRINHPAIRELEALSDHEMIRTMLRLGPMELLAISLCAGVGEELLFRGWLLPLLAGEDGSLVTRHPEIASAWWQWGGWLSSMDTFQTSDLVGWWSGQGGAGLTIALIVSSIGFGMMHPISRLYVGLTAAIGLYFGLLLILTGNLLIPITAHALYDAVQLWLAKREFEQESRKLNAG